MRRREKDQIGKRDSEEKCNEDSDDKFNNLLTCQEGSANRLYRKRKIFLRGSRVGSGLFSSRDTFIDG